MIVEDLTPYQKDVICNGCGAKGVWVRPPKAEFFKSACDQHDLGYYLGCNEAHRKQEDKKLKARMFNLVTATFNEAGFKAWINKRRYYTWCRVYYRALRMLGAKHFYYGDYCQPLP